MIPVLRRASKSRAAVGRSSGSGGDPLHRPSPLESGRPASVQADRRPVAVGVRGLGLLRQRAGLDLLHDRDGRVDPRRPRGRWSGCSRPWRPRSPSPEPAARPWTKPAAIITRNRLTLIGTLPFFAGAGNG